MRTELSRTTTMQTNFSGGCRAFVAFFEYAKPDGSALDASEIETLTNAANEAARELGADGVWRASAVDVEPIELAENEGLAARIDLTLTKISPDPVAELDETFDFSQTLEHNDASELRADNN